MPDDLTRRHLLLAETRLTGAPPAHPFKGVYLDGVVVARRGDLADGVEGRVADAQVAIMLAQHARGPGVPLPADLPQVPQPHVPIQRGGREEVRVLRVDTEAADLLLRQPIQVRRAGRARVRAPDEAVEPGEVENVRGDGVDLDAGKGLVGGRVRGPVDLGGGGAGEVKEAEGGVVRRGVEVRGVDGGELEGGYRSGVQVEGRDGRSGLRRVEI